MSLSVWVAFVRNFACIVKSLVPETTFLQQVPFPNSTFYPLSRTTSIELVIAPTQFAATIFNINSGLLKLQNGYVQRKEYVEWLSLLDKLFITRPQGTFGIEYAIMRHGLEADLADVNTNLFVGFWEIVFGLGFLVLTLNSLHIVGPTHPKPVIDALLAMEIGLAYILTLMWKAYRERAKGVDKLSKLASKIRALAHPTPVRLVTEAMNVGYDHGELCKALCILDKKYSPKWRKLIEQQLYVTEKIVEEEIGAVSSVLKALSSYDKKGADGLAHRDALADEIERNSNEANYLTYFDIVYLLLNFIAFYGYLLGVLAFYYPEYVNGVKAGPIWVKQLMFNMTDSDADWWGVLAGDLAWTIEPMLILLQPTIISGLLPAPAAPVAEKKQKPKATKAKAVSEAAATSTAASKVVPAASPSKVEGEGATWKEMPTPRQDAADAVGESDEGDKKNK